MIYHAYASSSVHQLPPMAQTLTLTLRSSSLDLITVPLTMWIDSEIVKMLHMAQLMSIQTTLLRRLLTIIQILLQYTQVGLRLWISSPMINMQPIGRKIYITLLHQGKTGNWHRGCYAHV